jgi:hypothetical protein
VHEAHECRGCGAVGHNARTCPALGLGPSPATIKRRAFRASVKKLAPRLDFVNHRGE